MLKSREAEKYIEEGLELRRQGKYAQAIIRYKKGISLEPDLIKKVYIYWGFALSCQNDYYGAMAKYQRAICLNPSDGTAYYNAGVILSYLGRYEEASVYYEKAIKFNYDRSRSYNNWGYGLGCLERYNEAIEKFRKAIDSSHNYDIAYINWGIVLYHQGATLKAKQAYNIGIMRAASHVRTQELISIYQKQIEIAKEQLITSNKDETVRSQLKMRLEALEQVFGLLQLPFEELSNMLVPSRRIKRDETLQLIEGLTAETHLLVGSEALRIF